MTQEMVNTLKRTTKELNTGKSHSNIIIQNPTGGNRLEPGPWQKKVTLVCSKSQVELCFVVDTGSHLEENGS